MKRRFTEEQIIGILREREAGGTVKEITRRHGVSERSFYWRPGAGVSAIGVRMRCRAARAGGSITRLCAGSTPRRVRG